MRLAIRSRYGRIAESEAAMAEIDDALGGIDVLFVNAGVGGFAPVPDVTEEFWDGIHNVNLRGAFFAIQKALPLMRDGGQHRYHRLHRLGCRCSGQCRLCRRKSGPARRGAYRRQSSCSPAKSASTWSAPAPLTPKFSSAMPARKKSPGMRAMLPGVVPMGRMGEAIEIARAVLFLASVRQVSLTAWTCSSMAAVLN